ncbi:hypothetical protein BC832DRAFT_614373 [Gaertneriomyces semiglobifer]|nr:hypothetical protein BC832DRAFT_614373 [Gaertneriomyces semiglobifer]
MTDGCLSDIKGAPRSSLPPLSFPSVRRPQHLRLQQPRLLDFDYNNFDYWTSTSTTSTAGLRLRQPGLQQPRLLDFDYDNLDYDNLDYNNLDYWTSTTTTWTTTTSTTGLRLRQPRLLDFDYNNLDYNNLDYWTSVKLRAKRTFLPDVLGYIPLKYALKPTDWLNFNECGLVAICHAKAIPEQQCNHSKVPSPGHLCEFVSFDYLLAFDYNNLDSWTSTTMYTDLDYNNLDYNNIDFDYWTSPCKHRRVNNTAV